jgi:hypothetical protein
MRFPEFFGFPRKRQAGKVTGLPDRRADERYEAYHPVNVSIGPYSAVSGTVINISLGGAAVLIAGWRATAPAEWLTRLEPGDELHLGGLLDGLVTCRAIKVDAGVIRVQFAQDEALRSRLREIIDSLAPL